MTTNPAQHLKQKLLDLAIHGQLVPQDPKDEPADALLERIREVKVKGEGEQRNGRGMRPACPHSRSNGNRVAGTNAAAKGLAALPITDDEKPFDLPKGWTWCRLGDAMADIATGPFGSMLHKSDYVQGGIPLVNPMHIVDGHIVPSDKMRVSEKTANRLVDYRLEEGMVVLGRRGEMGRCAPVKKSESGWLCGTGSFFLRPLPCVDQSYLVLLLSSRYARSVFEGDSIGTTMFNLNHGILKRLPIPLPPLAEQKRIVAKLDALMKEADTIAEGLEKLPALKDKARAKILDLAVRGKLVSQNAKDEPADALLERIRKVKVKDEGEQRNGRGTRPVCPHSRSNGKHVVGTNATAKGLAALPIPDDDLSSVALADEEKPYVIPKGWAWCRGRELFVDTETKLPHGEYFDYVDIDAIDNKRHAIIAPKHLLVSKAPSRASRGVCSGDTLFSIVRPYLENIAFVSDEYKDCIASTGFFVCRSCGALVPRFAFLLMTSPYVITGLNAFMKGDNSPSIRKDDILNFVFPLPPLAEQHRIVAKVDEMLAACEALTGGVRGA